MPSLTAVAIAVVALMLASVAVVVISVRSREASSVELVLEPATSVGDDPFRAPATAATLLPAGLVVQAGHTPLASAEPAMAGGRVVRSGETPGLYGGDLAGVCDPEAQADFLANPANAAVARAFAQVLGIPEDAPSLRSYLRALLPATLEHDTAVTNHGYRNGLPTVRPAVLERGTPVLVDNRGIPRVKCQCGNPLLPPPSAAAEPRYTGASWPGFDPALVGEITPAPEALPALELAKPGVGESRRTPFPEGSSPDGQTDDADANPRSDEALRGPEPPTLEARNPDHSHLIAAGPHWYAARARSAEHRLEFYRWEGGQWLEIGSLDVATPPAFENGSRTSARLSTRDLTGDGSPEVILRLSTLPDRGAGAEPDGRTPWVIVNLIATLVDGSWRAAPIVGVAGQDGAHPHAVSQTVGGLHLWGADAYWRDAWTCPDGAGNSRRCTPERLVWDGSVGVFRASGDRPPSPGALATAETEFVFSRGAWWMFRHERGATLLEAYRWDGTAWTQTQQVSLNEWGPDSGSFILGDAWDDNGDGVGHIGVFMGGDCRFLEHRAEGWITTIPGSCGE